MYSGGELPGMRLLSSYAVSYEIFMKPIKISFHTFYDFFTDQTTYYFNKATQRSCSRACSVASEPWVAEV